MSVCVKCGHDPDKVNCPYCGAPNQTVGNFDGKYLTICCKKDPVKDKVRGGK